MSHFCYMSAVSSPLSLLVFLTSLKESTETQKRPSEDVQFERLCGVCVVVLCCALFCPAGAEWRAISCMSYT